MPQKEEDDPALHQTNITTLLWVAIVIHHDDELYKNLYNEAKNNTLVVLAALAGRL